MSDKDPQADRTIQLDQIDPAQIELESQRDVTRGRVTPPPLPPEALVPSKPPLPAVSATPPKASKAKSIALVGVFVVLLVLAIFGGLKMGDLAHPAPSATVVSAPPASATVSTPPPSASTAPIQTITIQPIEVR